MPRFWKTIYVENDADAERVQQALEEAQRLSPTLDWDPDWDKVKEENLEAVECPVCQHMNDWDLKNCEKCGANLRIETENDE